MDIRAMQPADADAVAALWSDTFGYTEARNEPHRVIADKLEVRDDLLLVAEVDGRVVGTLLVGYDGHRGWLYRCAVADDHRRQGIARALVRAGEARLEALGCAKVNLQLHVTNEAGKRFWAAMGYGEEARVSMGKDLTAPETAGTDTGC